MTTQFGTALFGMFVHWGHSSQLGGDLSQLIVGSVDSLLLSGNIANIAVNEYHCPAATFNQQNYNAIEWAQLAKRLGVEYAIDLSEILIQENKNGKTFNGVSTIFTMTIVFDQIRKYPLRTKQILGISYEQLQSLLNCAQNRHEEIKAKKESQKIRINASGGGRQEKLTVEEQVGLCLFYLRQMPTFEILGMLFGISKIEANDTFHYWIPVIRKIQPSSLLEQVSNTESDFLFVQPALTNFNLLVDSLEQRIYRFSGKEEQQKYFSGKKKRHTLKSKIIGLPEGKDIVEVEVGAPGPTADINLYRKSLGKFDDSQPFTGDKAYQGGKNVSTPHKRKRKQELSSAAKSRK